MCLDVFLLLFMLFLFFPCSTGLCTQWVFVRVLAILASLSSLIFFSLSLAKMSRFLSVSLG